MSFFKRLLLFWGANKVLNTMENGAREEERLEELSDSMSELEERREERISDLEDQVDELRTRLDELEMEDGDHWDEIDELENKMIDLEYEIDNIESSDDYDY